MKDEKRKGSRYSAITEVTYDHLGMHFQGRISDLSQSGFFIDTINPLPKGSPISFRFGFRVVDSEVFIRGEGRVIWQRPLQGMGIRITQLSFVDKNRLADFLSGK